jgi:hypothetical protein
VQLQRVCYDTLPWLISFSLDLKMALTKFQQADLIGGIMCWIGGVWMVFGALKGRERKSLKWWGIALIVGSTWIIYSVWWDM